MGFKIVSRLCGKAVTVTQLTYDYFLLRLMQCIMNVRKGFCTPENVKSLCEQS